MFAFMICKPRRSFNSLWSWFVKVLSMAVELDFDTIGPHHYRFDAESLVLGGLLLTFLVMISTSLINLLVGLTVRDVAVLEKQASAKRIANQIDLLSVVEAYSFQSVVRFVYSIICLGPVCFCNYPRCWHCFLVPKPVVISPALSKDDLDAFELPISLRKRVIEHVKTLKSLKTKQV